MDLPNDVIRKILWIQTKEAKQIFSQIWVTLSPRNLFPQIGQLPFLQMLDIRENPQLASLPATIERKERNRELRIL